jgi:cytochrome c oxidase subunit 2
MVRNRTGHGAGRRLLTTGLAALAAVPALAAAAPAWNFQAPVTSIAQQQYDLHLFIFWICVVIFIGVFGVMFYSLFKHRKSVGHQAAAIPREHDGRDRVDGHSVPDPAVHGVAGDEDDPGDEGHVGARDDGQSHRLPVEVGYDYLGEGFGFYSNLSTPLAQIENRAPKGENYLLEVDHRWSSPSTPAYAC